MEIAFTGEEGWVRFDVAPTGRVEQITLCVGPLRGEIEATVGLDLSRLRNDLGKMLASESLSGAMTLESVEHDFRLRVSLKQGKGMIEGEVTDQVKTDGTLNFTLTTDQSHLGATLQQVDALLA